VDISIWLPKGGCSKTMLSLTMAGALAAQGRRVLLVDQDDQRGALAWSQLAARLGRTTPFVVACAYTPGFDDVLYDHPPVPPTKGFPTQLVVMPTLLDACTHLMLRKGLRMLEDSGNTSLVIPTRVRTDRAEQRELIAQAFADTPMIRDRAIYPTAYGRGQTIFSEGLALSHAKQARAEATAVLAAITQAYDQLTIRRAA
jgi:cellulose biosynthesis protein BcsQ